MPKRCVTHHICDCRHAELEAARAVVDVARECTHCLHGEEVRPCDCSGHRMGPALMRYDAERARLRGEE